MDNVFEGTNLIKERLRSKKVLLILDDVGDSKEVENLLGEYNWFVLGQMYHTLHQYKNTIFYMLTIEIKQIK